MNKRLPLLLSLLGVILLAASIAYWILQLYQPPQRPIAAVATAAMPDPSIDAAGTLFGGQVAASTASNYQLTGVVAAGRDSVAIIVAEGSPPKALKVGKELTSGVTLAEVHPRYVMLSDGGVMKRLDLATDAKAAAPMGGAGGAAPPGLPGAGNPGAPIMPSPVTPAGESVQEPPMAPGSVSEQMVSPSSNEAGAQEGQPSNPNGGPVTNNPNNPGAAIPGPSPVQAPPPTRPVGSPGNPSPPGR